MKNTRSVFLLIMAILSAMALAVITGAGCSERSVSFERQVLPILQKHCAECHAPGAAGYVQSGLELTSFDTLMQGTRFGPIVEPGDPLISVLNQLVEGRAHPSITMPHGRSPLHDSEVAVLRTWVAQGALNN